MSQSAKNIVIGVLLAVVAVQAYFLLSGRAPQPGPAQSQTRNAPDQAPALSPAPAPAQDAKPAAQADQADRAAGAKAPAIISFTRDTRAPYAVYFGFNAPVGQDKGEGPLARAPFDMAPAVPGEWLWMGPYVLRFTPEDPASMDPGQAYVFTARTDELGPLEGKTAHTLKMRTMKVGDVRAEFDPVPGKAGTYVMRVSIDFNREVDPKTLAPHVRLIDPKLGQGAPLPLELAPESSYGRSSSVTLVSQPLAAGQGKRTLTLMLHKDQARSTQRLPLDESLVWPVTLPFDPNLAVLALKPRADMEEGIRENAPAEVELVFSAKVDPEAIKNALTITPPVDYTPGADIGGVVLTGAFKPGQTYTFAFREGLTALDGARLAAPATHSLTMPDSRPGAYFAHPGMFLPQSGSKTVAVKGVNIKSANVRIERVYRNNIFFSLSYYDQSTFRDESYAETVLPYLGDTIAQFDLPVKYVKNQPQQAVINVGERVKGFEPGFYRISLSANRDSTEEHRWLMLTDMGLVAKRGHDDLMLWVTSLADLSPVAGAKVTVLSTKNQPLYKGTTDAQGLWRGRDLSTLDENRQPFIILVEKGSDLAFLHFENFKTDQTGLDVSGVEIAQAGYQAFLWGERDIYRPGETVRGALAVRDQNLKAPAPMPVKLRYADPMGREFAVDTVKTDAQGVAQFTRAVAAHQPTGSYVVEALAGEEVIGQYRFEVEDFKPDRITASVTATTKDAAPGQELGFGVEGAYLFGAPAAGMAAEVQVRLAKADFAPKGFEAYTFGDPERAFEPVALFTEEAKLDEAGKAQFKAAIPAGLKPPSGLTAQITARVSEAGGRGVAARLGVPVHAYPAYPGLGKLAESGLAPGQPHAFDYVVVDPSGREQAPASLVAELYEDRWQTVLRRQEYGQGYAYETRRDSRLVERRELASPAAKGQVSLTPPKFGSYRLRLTDPATGACAQLSFYGQGEGYNPWAMENPAKLELVAPKTDYMPGETAKLQVRAPFAGKLLVTVESTGVKDTMVVDMPANTGEVSVPIKPGYSPNVYITGVLVRKGADVTPGQAGRAFGALSLNVAREAGRQGVTILAPELVRPLTKLTITAKADPGAVVTLAAVDEGILQLVAQKTPDPWALFYAKRRLEVDSFDTFSLLLPELRAQAKRAPAGGDDDMSRFLRTESPQGDKSVAFWSGPLKADAQGRVQFTVDLPQFQGALRIMAVAANGNRFGSAQHTTRVKSPLTVLPTFPRFAQLGDEMELNVSVRNDTGREAVIAVNLEAAGPVAVAEAVKSVTVPNGAQGQVRFTVNVKDQEGVARLKVKAEGGGETTSASSEFAVRSPLPAESRVAQGVVAAEGQEVQAPGEQGFLPSSVRREVRLGRLMALRFAGKLSDLVGYPYGCVEQTASKGFALIYFADLARELDPETLAKTTPQALAQTAIGRILSMQHYSGYFTLWPGSDIPHAFASVYATHFLLEAARAGYQVNQQALASAVAAVGQIVKAPQRDDAFKTTAYGLYVLARAGKPDKGGMDNLQRNLLPSMSADAVGLLAAAYAATGNAPAAERLMAALGEPRVATRQADVFDSRLRAQALLTVALAEAAPAAQQTAEAARTLARLLENAPYVSTQEAGMAFMAFGKLAAKAQALPPCTGRVTAAGKELARFDSARIFTLRNIKEQGPLRIEPDPGCQAGALFYCLETRGVPELSAYAPVSQGLEVKREFFGRDGKPLDVSHLAQGSVVVVKTSVRATSGALKHVVMSQLLPTGLEVENPRLATSDKLPWMQEAPSATAYADYRADRVNVFLDLAEGTWAEVYTLCRAVIPGRYALPPVQAEAMYYPELRASAGLGQIVVEAAK